MCLTRRDEQEGCVIGISVDARVNEAVQLALSQRGTAGSHTDVVISPASQQHSSCASTAAPDVQAEQQPQIDPTAVDDQRYPVDDITMPTACELHVRAKNISVHVAYGSALPLSPLQFMEGRYPLATPLSQLSR